MMLPQRISKTEGLLILLLVMVAVGAAAYWLVPDLFPAQDVTPPTTSSTIPASSINVNFALDLLKDPRFSALSTVSGQITPHLGRKNPFVPVEATSPTGL